MIPQALVGDESDVMRAVYDAWNRLVAVKDGSGNILKAYEYDGLGRLISETDGYTTTDLYYSGTQVIEERSGVSTATGARTGSNGQVSAQYVFSPVYVNAPILRDADTNDDGTLDQRVYFTSDANFDVTSVISVSGGDGVVDQRMVYDPYGAVAFKDASFGAGSDGYGLQFLFQGMLFDSAIGWYYSGQSNLGRWYSPTLYVWERGDVGYIDSMALGQFCGDDPVDWGDPSGQQGTLFGVTAGQAREAGNEAMGLYGSVGAGAATQPSNGGSIVTTVAAGVGLGEETSIGGTTGVRINDTDFFITGTPQEGMWTPKTGTTSVLFIVKKSDPTKLYRLDYDMLKQGANAGQEGWEHNQKGVAKILDLAVSNHQPAGALAKAAGRTITIFKWGGKALFVAGLVGSGVEIYNAQNKPREIVAQAGGWAGAWAGAEAGAAGGAWAGGSVGLLFDVIGAAPGAAIGGFDGAVGGGIGGFWAGHKIVTAVWDWIFTPLEKEEYLVVNCPDGAATQPGK